MDVLQDDVQKLPCVEKSFVFYNVGMLRNGQDRQSHEKDASLALRFLSRSISDCEKRGCEELRGVCGE